MKIENACCTLFSLMFLFVTAADIAQESQILEKKIPALSLRNSLIPTSIEQPVMIYLPPTYLKGNASYPVIYFLPGFGDFVKYFIDGTYQGFGFKGAMDKLINEGRAREMIVVVVNGFNFFGGSFYTNSSVTGNWEDFVVKDVVGFIDKNFRTIANPVSRAITGHSMGGFGVINIAMHHPEIFSVAYALSPGLYDKTGLTKQSILREDIAEKYLAEEENLKKISKEDAIKKLDEFTEQLVKEQDFLSLIALAYGAAFSPNPNGNPPYIDYPFTKVNGNLVADSLKLKNYENGFGGLPEKINMYKGNLRKLKLFTIEVGLFDEDSFIKDGVRYFSNLLYEENIPHNLVFHDGMHQSNLGIRIQEFMLPAISNVLNFKSE